MTLEMASIKYSNDRLVIMDYREGELIYRNLTNKESEEFEAFGADVENDGIHHILYGKK